MIKLNDDSNHFELESGVMTTLKRRLILSFILSTLLSYLPADWMRTSHAFGFCLLRSSFLVLRPIKACAIGNMNFEFLPNVFITSPGVSFGVLCL